MSDAMKPAAPMTSCTYAELVRNATERFQHVGIEDAKLDARLLMQHVTGWSWSDFLLEQYNLASQETINRYEELVSRREEHIPLQHLTGEQEFMGLPFHVTPDVLIPRQDTELLVELAMPYCEGAHVLDMCTGSGCIIISLAKLGKPKSVIGVDISVKALTVAKANAENLEAEVAFVESDLFENVQGTFDVIVSNPPYITAEEMKELAPEVFEREPHLALYGGEDGLVIYRRLIPAAKEHLTENGWLMLEIGCGQGEAVKQLMIENGYKEVTVHRDYAGHDRVVTGHLQIAAGK